MNRSIPMLALSIATSGAILSWEQAAWAAAGRAQPLSANMLPAYTTTVAPQYIEPAKPAEVAAPSAAPKEPASGAREEGLEHYKAGRFHHAEVYLRVAVTETPGDAMLHYYLANSLVYIKKHEDAIAEYRKCFNLDPSGPFAQYCRKALAAYRLQVPDAPVQTQPSKVADTTDGADEEKVIPVQTLADKYSSKKKTRTPAGNTADTSVNRAISEIRRQADLAKSRHRSDAETLSTFALRSGELEVTRIEENARIEIDRIMNPPPIVGRGFNPLLFNPELQKQRAAEVRRQADEAVKVARGLAQEKSESYKRWSQQKEFELDEVAANLERQLHERSLPGTPRLSHVGTGLYVRNYDSPIGPSPYPEPHSGVARIRPIDHPATDDEEELRAPQETMQDSNPPDSTVRGTVINLHREFK